MRGDFCWYWWNCWSSLNELKWDVIFHQYQQKSPLTSTHSVMVNNSTNINKNHLSPKLIEWWSTIPPISTKITSHCEMWFWLILVELLTITQWVEVRGDFCWYWWNCWPSLNEFRWEVTTIPPISANITSYLITLIDGQQFHQYQQKSPLTSSHWVMVNNSMSLGERWFLLILVELLTIIQWVEVRGDFCWYWCNYWHHYKNHLSSSLIEWWSTIPPISTKITSHLNSLSDGQQFHQYQQKSPLTITHWVV
jgi:hypothetical protein